ncbi:MAG: lysozyme inhibitor LprI family protein [Solidesulfovibrio sp. DCME]|uniref:lysozyme inhibitor LprI family protein n=1 Tax=Solidesulfovibrio sp. DCME TaxID=3447380 RepID=UPI003D0F41B2
MRVVLLVALFFFASVPAAWAQSQADLNASACQAAKKADAELNAVYNAIIQKNAGEKAFLDKFKAAQRAWLAFRDAELAARFKVDPSEMYASSFNLCWCTALAELTEKRTAQLKPWRDGVVEGDICAGSYPVH